MSQYPSPYMPPNVSPYYGAPPDPLKSAKRASILMFVLGGLVTLMGLCNSISILGMPAEQYMKQAQAMQPNQQALPVSAEEFKTLMLVVVGMFVVGGLVFTGLGVGVRRGGKVSTFFATGLTAVMLAGCALFFLLAVVASIQSPVILAMACILVIPLVLLTWLIFTLIASLRSLPQLNAAQQQYHAQYMQYQQNMHAYMGYAQQQQMQPRPMGYPPQSGQGYAQAPPQQQQLPNPMTPPPQPENPGTPPQQ